jgi:hypothetical protein
MSSGMFPRFHLILPDLFVQVLGQRLGVLGRVFLVVHLGVLRNPSTTFVNTCMDDSITWRSRYQLILSGTTILSYGSTGLGSQAVLLLPKRYYRSG